MIIGFMGRMGSGKTLSMVKRAYEYYRKGYTIYSNIRLNFPFKYFTLNEIMEYTQQETSFNKAIFLIDEAHIFLDSRTSMGKRNLIMSYFILQTRKRDIWLFYTTQYPHQIDKRLRSATDMLCECSSELLNNIKLNLKVKMQGKIKMITNHYSFMDYDNIKEAETKFIANKYYNLYDTNEIVKRI